MAVVNVKSEIAGNVWKIQLKAGDKVEFEGEIMILESMKMEIPVLSPKAGTIKEIRVNEGEAIGEGQLVAIIDANQKQSRRHRQRPAGARPPPQRLAQARAVGRFDTDAHQRARCVCSSGIGSFGAPRAVSRATCAVMSAMS